jgi:hypothetical protein
MIPKPPCPASQKKPSRSGSAPITGARSATKLLSGLPLLRQALSLVFPPDEEDRPVEHQRIRRESIRRPLEESAARLGQPPNHGVAVVLHQDRSGAAGGVMTG